MNIIVVIAALAVPIALIGPLLFVGGLGAWCIFEIRHARLTNERMKRESDELHALTLDYLTSIDKYSEEGYRQFLTERGINHDTWKMQIEQKLKRDN